MSAVTWPPPPSSVLTTILPWRLRLARRAGRLPDVQTYTQHQLVFHANIPSTIWRRCSGSSTQSISDQGRQSDVRPPEWMSTTIVRAREQLPRQEVGELLVLRPGGRAREGAVHGGPRRPAAREGERCLGRHARDDDDAARDLIRLQVAREVDARRSAPRPRRRDASEHHRRRPVAVRDDDDRKTARAPVALMFDERGGSRAGRIACQAHRGRPCSEPGSHSSGAGA